MSLLALVDPESSALWRASFAIAAIGGAVALIALRGAAPGKLGLAAYISAIALYVLIGILAIAPHITGELGLQAAPVRVEAALLTILVFAGVNVAWLLLFEEAPPDYASPGRADQLVRRDGAGHGPAWYNVPNSRSARLSRPPRAAGRTAVLVATRLQPPSGRMFIHLHALGQTSSSAEMRALRLDAYMHKNA
jgi:hypothetical protein